MFHGFAQARKAVVVLGIVVLVVLSLIYIHRPETCSETRAVYDRDLEEYIEEYREVCARIGWHTVTVYLSEDDCNREDVIVPLGIGCEWVIDSFCCEVVTVVCSSGSELVEILKTDAPNRK